MPSNIEIKAKVEDMNSLEALTQNVSDTPCTVIQQEDTFFNTQNGRLKLRTFPENSGTLIYYNRPDSTAAKQSHYQLYNADKPDELKLLLDKALGTKVVVKKTRHLYICGQTRIHLDWVEKLGTFMELEVILHNDQNPQEGYKIAEELMDKLNIQKSQLISGAYADMLAKNSE